MHPPVALREERDAAPVGQELERVAAAGLPHPGFVLQRVDHFRLTGLGIERHQPAVLVIRRAGSRDNVAAVGRDHRHRPSDLAVRAPAGALGFATAVAVRLRRAAARGLGDRRREAAVRPDALARLQVENREQTAILGVANVRASWDVLGVAGLGHVVRHDRVLRAGGPLGDEDEDVNAVARQHQVGRALAILQLEGRQLQQLGLLLGPLLLFLLLPQIPDQLFLFIPDEPLAVGEPGIGLLRRNIGELRDQRRRSPLHGDDEEVAVAHVGDVRIVPRPARARLGAGRPGDERTGSGSAIVDDDVAAFRRQEPPPRGIPSSVGGRRVVRLLIGQPAWRATVSRDNVERFGLVARLPPGEIEVP
jgi:hypothetical protein